MKNFYLLFILILTSIVTRLILSFFINSESGGDTFEFLLISDRILDLENPFVGVKRLPFFPIMLIPSFFLNIDGVIWGKILNAFLAGGSVWFVYKICKQFNLQDLHSQLVVLLFTFSQVYLFFSMRPLSYALYVILFLASIYFANEKKYIQTAISLGLLSMTRHEGFLVALVMFAYFLITVKSKSWLKYFLIPSIIYLIFVFPFFINNIIYHKNLFFLGYLDDGGGLYQPQNFDQFLNNFAKITNAIVSTWGNPVIMTGRLEGISGLFTASFLLILFGLIIFLSKPTKEKIMVVFLLFTQIAVAFWFQPSGRYIQHLVPFFSLFVILGLSRISKHVLPIGVTVMLLFTSFFTVYKKVNEFNFDTMKQRNFTNTVKALSNEQGTFLMDVDPDYTHSYIAIYYLGADRVKFTNNFVEVDRVKYLLEWKNTPYVKRNN